MYQVPCVFYSLDDCDNPGTGVVVAEVLLSTFYRWGTGAWKDWGIHSLVIRCWLKIQLTLHFLDQKRNTGERVEALAHCSVHTDIFSTQISLSTNYYPLPSVREIMRPLTTCWDFTTHTEIKRTIIVSFKLVGISSACVANWLPNFRVLLKQMSQ